MVREGTGRLVAVGKAKTRYVSVPAEVAGDDRFPFEDGEEVKVTIDEPKKRLLITRCIDMDFRTCSDRYFHRLVHGAPRENFDSNLLARGLQRSRRSRG